MRNLAWVSLLVAAVLTFFAPVAAGENLFSDPSFTQSKPRDQFGGVFAKWGGFIHADEGCSKLEPSPIGHNGGKTSCLMMGDTPSRVELIAGGPKTLDAGRYRITFFARGMDVGTGQYKESLGMRILTSEPVYRPIKKTGNWGWTPVTYVFDMAKGGDFGFRLSNRGGGRIWITDCTLEKVASDVELTADPLIGKEEAPFGPEKPLGDKTIHCDICGMKVDADAKICWACGEAPHVEHDAKLPLIKVLADFSNGKTDPFKGGKIVTEKALATGNCMRIESLANISGASIQTLDGKPVMDWSQFDFLRFDVFNPSDQNVRLTIDIRDPQSKGYWGRVNLYLTVVPGKSTISLPTNCRTGERNKLMRPLMRDQVNFLGLGCSAPITVANFRLERTDVSAVQFDGLWALDFGSSESPVMEGYRQASTWLTYNASRGFGWEKPKFWHTQDVLQPDALYQDYICVEGGDFRFDVPNGKYHVWMNIDSPGGFWGENQTYTQRQVLANGKVVVDEKRDFAAFEKFYFRNAHLEDLPGVNTFERYVQRTFSPKEFDVEVSDGKLLIGFKGASWANCLSSMVVYPLDKAEKGKKFLAWTTERRAAQFNDTFRQIEPKRGTPPASGYVLFQRNMMNPVNAYDSPAEGEQIPADGLSLAVAQGEEQPMTFALQPAGDVGAVDLKISELKSESGAVLDAKTLQSGWIDYRITRIAVDGASYSAQPRYWHPTPAPASPNVTRRFWIRVRTTADAKPGTYKGTITVQPANANPQSIPVAIRVLPFKLDEVTDVAVGPNGIWMTSGWDGCPEGEAFRQAMVEKSLDQLRADGWTSFSYVPTIPIKGKDGKLDIDFSGADKMMEKIKAKGFTQMLCAYGAGVRGYNAYGAGSGPDTEAATKYGFKDVDSFLTTLYTTIDKHAVEKDWLPVAYNLCDEPKGKLIERAVNNALAHRKIQGLQRTFFIGETSLDTANPNSVKDHADVARALPIACLNIHDEAAIKMVHDAGNKLSLYNQGSRWSYGRYQRMIVLKYQLVLRHDWHYNIVAGDPYYALDCREDDYCWFNTDETQAMIPTAHYLTECLPGINDYRAVAMLGRLVNQKKGTPAAEAGQKIIDAVMALAPGKDRPAPKDASTYDQLRNEVIEAICNLVK